MQGFPYRSIPPGTGGTYWFARLQARPVRKTLVTGTWTACYRAMPPKSTVGGRLREKSIVNSRLREKKGRRRRRGKEERRKKRRRRKNTSRRPCLRAVAARGSLVS
ncbi:hypothetical protein BHM03_00049560, partial [Ensete ventricosum]